MPRQIGGAGLDALGWTEARSLVQWLGRVLGRGRPLGDIERREMEAFFGRSLEEVRVHDSRQAGEMARRLGAEAFTIGADVFGDAVGLSAPGPDAPGLMAHELTHVVQQTQPPPTGRTRPRLAGGTSASSQTLPGRAHGVQVAAHPAPAVSSAEAPGEAEARASERVVQRSAEEATQRGQSAATVDLEKLADRVYRLMREELLVSRERRAPGAGLR